MRKSLPHMKFNRLKPTLPARPSIPQALELVSEMLSRGRQPKLPLYLFLALSFNLVVAPIVYAASGSEFSRSQAWALGLLGLGTVALSVYLFIVMFVPEKF